MRPLRGGGAIGEEESGAAWFTAMSGMSAEEQAKFVEERATQLAAMTEGEAYARWRAARLAADSAFANVVVRVPGKSERESSARALLLRAAPARDALRHGERCTAGRESEEEVRNSVWVVERLDPDGQWRQKAVFPSEDEAKRCRDRFLGFRGNLQQWRCMEYVSKDA